MSAGRLARLLLLIVLTLLIGWPALATFLESRRGESKEPSGSGLIVPISDNAAVRPVRLALKTCQLVGLTEALALPVGVALAFLLFRTDLKGRALLMTVLGLMALVPMPLHATSWLGGFGNLGRSQAIGSRPFLVGLPGAAVVHAIAALPWIVWIVGIGLRAVEPELEDTARLDLRPWQVLFRVTLRRGVGAIAAAALAVAVLTASDMTVTDLLSVRTYAEEAYLQFQIGQGPASAASVALPPLVVLGVLLALLGRLLLRSDPARVLSARNQPHTWQLQAWERPARFATFLLVGFLLVLPLYSLIWRAGRVGGIAAQGLVPHWSWQGLVGSVQEAIRAIWPPTKTLLRKPLAASLIWSSVSAVLTVTFAWGLAWVSRKPGIWQGVAAFAVALALATPGPVVGMALVLAYRGVPWLYNSAGILVLADVARTWPYAFLILWPALRSIPRGALESAELDGLSPWRQLVEVALPLTRGATLFALAGAFLLALGELPASGLVAPPGITTLPVLVWGALHIGVESRLAAIALLLLLGFLLGGAVFGWVWLRLRRIPQGAMHAT